MDAVRAGGQSGIGEDGDAAGGADDVSDFRFGAGDDDGAGVGFPAAVEHVEDHRAAGDVGQRLAWQAGGGHTGGDDDDAVHADFEPKKGWEPAQRDGGGGLIEAWLAAAERAADAAGGGDPAGVSCRIGG